MIRTALGTICLLLAVIAVQATEPADPSGEKANQQLRSVFTRLKRPEAERATKEMMQLRVDAVINQVTQALLVANKAVPDFEKHCDQLTLGMSRAEDSAKEFDDLAKQAKDLFNKYDNEQKAILARKAASKFAAQLAEVKADEALFRSRIEFFEESLKSLQVTRKFISRLPDLADDKDVRTASAEMDQTIDRLDQAASALNTIMDDYSRPPAKGSAVTPAQPKANPANKPAATVQPQPADAAPRAAAPPVENPKGADVKPQVRAPRALGPIEPLSPEDAISALQKLREELNP